MNANIRLLLEDAQSLEGTQLNTQSQTAGHNNSRKISYYNKKHFGSFAVRSMVRYLHPANSENAVNKQTNRSDVCLQQSCAAKWGMYKEIVKICKQKSEEPGVHLQVLQEYIASQLRHWCLYSDVPPISFSEPSSDRSISHTGLLGF